MLKNVMSHLNYTISDNWQKMNVEPVCFEARDNKYGAFNVPKGGRIKTMKLIHKSGSIRCNPEYNASYWSCSHPSFYHSDDLLTIITNANNEAVLPPVEDMRGAINICDDKKFVYSLNGTSPTSPELVFRDLPNYLVVSRNQELRIWHGQDWVDCTEYDNSGQTCVDVYAWYA